MMDLKKFKTLNKPSHLPVVGWLLVLASLIFNPLEASANNLTISNLAVTAIDTNADTMTFSFDVSQDNSWRSSVNHDAVWIFLKYSTDGGATWNHASMSGSGTNPSGFTAPANFEIIIPPDETGLFLQRTSFGTGTITATGTKIVWDYGQDGLSDATAQAANTINKIFGVEMAYIPQGAFYAGDGNSSSNYRFKQGNTDDDPWYVSSENPITTTGSGSDGYRYTTSGSAGESSSGSVFLIPDSYPKGFNAFYLMKYELTEGQWVEFFNTLTPAQKTNRDITSNVQGGKNSDAVVNRNTISWDSSNPLYGATTTRQARAMTYISWPDTLAYADWAGLRPITELEYEKAARGKDINAVVNEYAWGSTSLTAAAITEITPNSDESGTENISNANANVNRSTLAWTSGDGRAGGPAASQKGPLRAGIFARSNSSRATSGAGYYGNMELSGNVHEPVVTVGRAEGRSFLATHGDGRLTTLSSYEGNATNLDWPGIYAADTNRGITGTVGAGYRGGDFNSSSLIQLQTSSRTFAAKDPDSEGDNQRYDAGNGLFYGGRLGRTAP